MCYTFILSIDTGLSMKDLLSKMRGKKKTDKDSENSEKLSLEPSIDTQEKQTKAQPYLLSEKLTGKLLIASPDMQDPRFSRTVIYICSHTKSSGSVGFIINRVLGDVNLAMLLEQLSIDVQPEFANTPVQLGGPLEIRRGFVLHSDDYIGISTMQINNHIAVTSTSEILKDIAQGKGPKNSMLILGYAGWTQGQLEQELKLGGWLTVESDHNILFNYPMDSKWKQALTKLGVQPGLLSSSQGTA